jgi:hypothetical protein
MTKLLWDQEGEKLYSTGTDRGVLYVNDSGLYRTGEAWNGLTKFQKSSEGGDSEAIYADNTKYLNLTSTEDKKGQISCYTFPDGWYECQGNRKLSGVPGLRIGQQVRKSFGFSCRTLIGNDTDGDDYGYKLHIVYGAKASPSDEEYQTVNNNPEAIEFSYDFETTPINVGHGMKPSAMFEIDSTDFTDENIDRLHALEDILYGTADSDPRLPSIEEVIAILGATTAYKLTITEATNTTVTVKRNNINLENNADIAIGDLLTIIVSEGDSITVNGNAFTSGNTYTVSGNTTVVSTAG